MEKAVVLLSGGLDSCTCMAVAESKGYDVYPISFNYHQRHSIELEGAKKIAAYYGVKKHLIIETMGYAEVLGATHVYIGVNSVDYSGYPDCRPEFIQKFQALANYATTATAVEGRKITIETPLQDLSKKDIVLLGTKLGAPFQFTHSCYKGGEKACGICDSCKLRLRGFAEAGVEDPIDYETREI